MADTEIAMNCEQILSFLKIRSTTARIEILKFALLKKEKEFTFTEIRKTVGAKKLSISISTIIATLLLFTTRGIFLEKKSSLYTKEPDNKQGRPAKRLYVSKAIIDKLNSHRKPTIYCL